MHRLRKVMASSQSQNKNKTVQSGRSVGHGNYVTIFYILCPCHECAQTLFFKTVFVSLLSIFKFQGERDLFHDLVPNLWLGYGRFPHTWRWRVNQDKLERRMNLICQTVITMAIKTSVHSILIPCFGSDDLSRVTLLQCVSACSLVPCLKDVCFLHQSLYD